MTTYHYTECGLDNVYIEGMEPRVDDAGETVYSVPYINRLQAAIALSIVTHEHGMSGKELRFIRTEMGLTQAELANLLHREPLTIGRWERAERPISNNSETLIRLFAVERLALDVELSTEQIAARSIPTAKPQRIRIDGSNPKEYRPIAA